MAWRLMQSSGGWICVDAARYACTNTHSRPEDAQAEANRIDAGLARWNEIWPKKRAELKRIAAEIQAKREAQDDSTK